MYKKYFRLLILALLILVVLLSGYILYNYFSARVVWKSSNDVSAVTGKNFVYFSQLDGTGQEEKADVAPPVVGVMVDNHPDAYPQFGLNLARVVYEVPVEGGITRFLAIYPGRNLAVAQVGPVRSARPYFLDWLAEYGDALYLHSGGSAEALDLIKERKIFDANEFWWGSYYWRDDTRSAPHNLFTSSDNWRKIIAEDGANRTAQEWSGWKFDEQPPITSTTQSVRQIKIVYAPNYKVWWIWDASKSGFTRTVNGEQVNGAAEILAQNIVVQYVNVKSIDEVDRKKITTVGSGEARVLRDGVMVRGSWKKDDLSSRTRFYDDSGAEISLRPGVTWIEIVPKDAAVEVTS